jgi:predicted XRE-type DNA-binding protein
MSVSERDTKPVFEEGSGNVFLDLGFLEHEAVNLVARLKLMTQIERIIKEEGWTRQETAHVLGIRQSQVSDLMTSRSGKFTVDMLMELLDRLGRRVELTVKAKDDRPASTGQRTVNMDSGFRIPKGSSGRLGK